MGSQDALGAPTFTISGYVQTSGGAGVSGVNVSGNNEATSTVTATDGSYSITVPNHWSGMITVTKAGWLITPASKIYSNVRANITNENYIAYQPKISGYVKTNSGAGISGVTVTAGWAASALTNANGYYELFVPYGWTDTLSVSMADYNFTPRDFSNVTADQVQDFSGYQPKISGYVKKADGTGLGGVTITTVNNGTSTETNSNGYYEITVPYYWYGMIRANLPGFTFNDLSFASVISEQTNQNFTGYQPTISGYTYSKSGVTVTASGAGSVVSNASYYYSITVPYGWSGTVSAALDGFNFAESPRTYTNVTSDMLNENFTAFQPKISGYVQKPGTALSGVSITASNGGPSTVTDVNGYYQIAVTYGWSGILAASKAGYSFDVRNFSNVTTDQNEMNFEGTYAGITIRPDGSGDYLNIQAAINDAVNGDIIKLEPGTYTGTGNRDIDFKGKAITIRGVTGDPNDCVIDCQADQTNPHRGFRFVSGETNNSVLESVKIINGYAPQESAPYTAYFGGAIFNYMSSPKINNCIISGNKARQYGGGICNYNSNAIISNCVISNNATLNTGYMGGGILNEKGSPAIINCIINNNESGGGGGIRNQSTNPIIRNCFISGNYAAFGGGIYDYNSTPIIRNCIISGNGSQEGGGFSNVGNDYPQITSCTIVNNSGNYGGAFHSSTSGLSQFSNCIVWGNSSWAGPAVYGSNYSLTYSDVQGGKTGIGNINANPLFTDGYHLPADSPCVNTGNPAYIAEPNETDIDGEPRKFSRVDMGADEMFVGVGLKVSKNTFAFEMPGLNTNPTSQILTVTNYGAFPLNWHIENNCNWLTISPTSGQTQSLQSTEVSIGIDHNNADYGTYSCQFVVADPYAENSPQTVTVNLNVIGPEIGLNKTNYSFTAFGKNSSVVPEILNISNTGVDTLKWQIQIPSDCNWLIIEPQSGTALDSNTVTISADLSKANYGNNTAQFAVVSADAINSPQTVTVNLTVNGPSLQTDPSGFWMDTKDSNSIEKTFTIRNTGYGTMHWSIDDFNDIPWIASVTPSSGECEPNETDTITVIINPAAVGKGGYQEVLTIRSPECASTKIVIFTLNVYTPKIIHVPMDYNTIEEATKAAQNFDTIIVHPGKYAGFFNWEKMFTIQSIEPENPAVVAATIIESTALIGGGSGLEFTIDGLSFIYNPAIPQIRRGIDIRENNAVIKNCIIRNFPESGIYFNYAGHGKRTKIEKCIVSGNGFLNLTAGIYGGYDAEIKNCLITNNYAPGIYVAAGKTDIINCTIADNGWSGYAPAAYGIIMGRNANVSVENSIVWNRTYNPPDAPPIPQIRIQAIPGSTNLKIDHSLIKDGQAGIMPPNTIDVIWQEGNIESDPCFAKMGILDDNDTPEYGDDYWIAGDYHLKSHFGRWRAYGFVNMDASGNGIMDIADFAVLAGEWQGMSKPFLVPGSNYYYQPYLRADMDRNGIVDYNDLTSFCGSYADYYEYGNWVCDDVNSPCIDGGDPNSEWRQEPWPHGKRVNMGAYGNTPQASMSSDLAGNAADLNNDGSVNLLDYSDFADVVNKASYPHAADINKDSFIDAADLLEFCENWLRAE